MRHIQTVKSRIRGLIYTFLLVTAAFSGAFAAGGDGGALAGNWIGSFQTPGPSGSLEVTLMNSENNWSGEVKIEGPEHKILTKQAQNLKIVGENLTFMIEIVGAEVTFTGTLTEGKLSGGLEAIEDGKTVAMGSWEMTRPRN